MKGTAVHTHCDLAVAFNTSKIFKIMSWKKFYHSVNKIESESRSVVSDSLWPHGLYSPWNSPGQDTGVGSLSLLQGIFPTQESNQGLLHCRRIPYQLSHQGSTITVRRKNIYWVSESFLGGWCVGDVTCRRVCIDLLSRAVWMCGKISIWV